MGRSQQDNPRGLSVPFRDALLLELGETSLESSTEELANVRDTKNCLFFMSQGGWGGGGRGFGGGGKI